jgi:hypothetical protein
MKHHYIPACYLKMFTNKSDKSFYVINKEDIVKFKKIISPKLRNPRQIASEENFYSIDFKLTQPNSVLNNLDLLAIEKSFHLYEVNYSKILNKLITNKNITWKDAFSLSYSFIDFKLRNKYYRINSIENKKEKLFDDVTKDFFTNVRKSTLKRFNTTLEEAENTLIKIKTEALENHNYSKEIHLSNLAKNKQDINSVLFKITNELFNSNWTLLKTESIDFITSDNPGYCIDKDENAFNTKFQKGFSFIIPIASQYCLYIDNNQKTGFSEFKPINHFICKKDLVDIINNGSSFFVNKYIISNNKSTLIKIEKEIIPI